MTSMTARKRLKDYNTGCPDRAFRFGVFLPVPNARAVELLLHRALAPRRLGGRSNEWFAVDHRLPEALLQYLRNRRPSYAEAI